MAPSPTVAFVFGSRSVCDPGTVGPALVGLLPDSVKALWSGGCRGADRLAEGWARSRGLTVRSWPADWARSGRRAGIERSKALVAALPAGSVCVCFAPHGVTWPGAAAVAKQGGLRSLLSPGSRASVGFCLGRRLPTWVVFACGTAVRACSGSGPRPEGWYEPSRAVRNDLADGSSRCIGEDGWDVTADSDATAAARENRDGDHRDRRRREDRDRAVAYEDEGFAPSDQWHRQRQFGDDDHKPKADDTVCRICIADTAVADGYAGLVDGVCNSCAQRFHMV